MVVSADRFLSRCRPLRPRATSAMQMLPGFDISAEEVKQVMTKLDTKTKKMLDCIHKTSKTETKQSTSFAKHLSSMI